MKNLLNKFLCWMWGHVWECYARLLIKWPNGVKGYETLLKCKHCGAIHE